MRVITAGVERDIAAASLAAACKEPISQRIIRITQDLEDINAYYTVPLSLRRQIRLKTFFQSELQELQALSFDTYDPEGKIDYLLLQNFLNQNLRKLESDAIREAKVLQFLPFSHGIVKLIEERLQGNAIDGKGAAQSLSDMAQLASRMQAAIDNDRVYMKKYIAFHVTQVLAKFRSLLSEWYGFYKDYDPLFTWWAADPYPKADAALYHLSSTIEEAFVGVGPEDEDAIVGDPIGREGLLEALEEEYIPYTPEELIAIAKREYEDTVSEMTEVARDLGFSEWHDALEYVKDQYVEPGQQTELTKQLMKEATEYVKRHDLVTIPDVCAETSRVYMMSAAKQKINPFFTGGPYLQVSYPTSAMSHTEKLMSLRGNNKYFARATVLHEMIPGHRLQFHYLYRSNIHRTLFMTPFCIEGWAFYWETLLYDARSWKKSPEDKIGLLFWRMHRCVRIIFSLKFHLGQMSPEECIDMLVDWVGHERATAEGEVRRSFNGDYGPLYQAGYMLGMLQLRKLREEIVDTGKMVEKEFHDTFLKANQMPIELFRALITGQELQKGFETSWRFYEPVPHDHE